jgi:hypothetical protein
MCGRLRVGKGFLHVSRLGRSSHVFGLLARFTCPLAIMPSADQVPVMSTHSTMPWPEWVVLIARSTRRQLLEKRQHISTLRLTTKHDVSVRIDAMNLKNRLRAWSFGSVRPAAILSVPRP